MLSFREPKLAVIRRIGGLPLATPKAGPTLDQLLCLINDHKQHGKSRVEERAQSLLQRLENAHAAASLPLTTSALLHPALPHAARRLRVIPHPKGEDDQQHSEGYGVGADKPE